MGVEGGRVCRGTEVHDYVFCCIGENGKPVRNVVYAAFLQNSGDLRTWHQGFTLGWYAWLLWSGG